MGTICSMKMEKKLRVIIMPSFQLTHSNTDIFNKNLTIISIMSEHIFDQATVVLGKLKCLVLLRCLFALRVVPPELVWLSQHQIHIDLPIYLI